MDTSIEEWWDGMGITRIVGRRDEIVGRRDEIVGRRDEIVGLDRYMEETKA